MHPTARAITAALLTLPLTAQTSRERTLTSFQKRRTSVLAEAGQRHLKLGSWARKAGLVPQATAQFLRAKQVADGHNPAAKRIVSLMESLKDKFWIKNRQDPPLTLLREYDRRAEELRERDTADRSKLAKTALKLGLERTALDLYREILRDVDGQVDQDEDGHFLVDGVELPDEVAIRLVKNTFRINGAVRLRDDFIGTLRPFDELAEVASDRLLVQTDGPIALARRVHRGVSALWPHLTSAIGRSPKQQVRIFIFTTRSDFDAYLVKARFGESQTDSVTDPRYRAAVLCSESDPPAVVQARAMHEATQLFEHAATGAVFPSWYTEAMAETYGGEDTFERVEGGMDVGGMLSPGRIQNLRESELIPLRELLNTDRRRLLRVNPEQAERFTVQAWAFLRYLQSGAGDEVRRDFRSWESRCRDAAATAGAKPHQFGNENTTRAPFWRTFGRRIPELESGFARWLVTL